MAAAAAATAPRCVDGSAGFLLSRGAGRKTLDYRRSARIYSQGDAANAIFVLLEGSVILMAVSYLGKDAVLGVVKPGEFFGEDCVLEAERRGCSAIAVERCTVLRVEKQDLRYVLRNSVEFNETFLQQVLRRKILVEAALADQLFSSSERRLARVLMLLARGSTGAVTGAIPRISQTTLAAMVGTTRSRISYFLGKFRCMGVVQRGRTLTVNIRLLEKMLTQQ
jgi:CRP/FNR family transcriptional regulator, cyclic AMP receptor protein